MAEETHLRRRRLRFLQRRRTRKRAAAMTLMEHLGELRSRLVISAVAFLVLAVIAFFFYEPIARFITRPLCQLPPDVLGPQGCDLIITSALQGFQFRLKLTALVGLSFASPVWLYQIYAFIVPALTPKEKRYAVPFAVAAVVLFLAGSTIAYLVLEPGLRFLVEIGGDRLVAFFTAGEYLNLVGLMFIAFGIMFELPMVIVFLGLAGVVTVEQLRRQRKVALIAIAVLTAVATPTQDPFTMLVMILPLYLLYEGAIVIIARLKKQ